MSQPNLPWRPTDEAEATANLTHLVEWLRATGHAPAANPALLRDWAARRRPCLLAAVAGFIGLGPATRLSDALPPGGRLALTMPGGRWTRDALRAGWPDAPNPAGAALAALAASNLLGQELRPDQRLHWAGDPGDPWPYAALLTGACVTIGGPAPPGARHYVARPSSWVD